MSMSCAGLYLIEILHQTTTTWRLRVWRRELYLIEILHQTTTGSVAIHPAAELYLIEILHQTTTPARLRSMSRCCILLKFYIKPQLHRNNTKDRKRCILLKFYIKPQQVGVVKKILDVVSYWNSTSNHNPRAISISCFFVVSYWNSTSNHNNEQRIYNLPHRCILLKFYIKPQHLAKSEFAEVLLYLIEILHQTTTSSCYP